MEAALSAEAPHPGSAPFEVPDNGPEHPRDSSLTRDRREQKLLVDRLQSRSLVRELDAKLERHFFRHEEREALPDAQSFTTTVYFDTPNGDVLCEALSGHGHLKLRAREYYTFHPALASVASSPDQLLRLDPAVWLEIKIRDADHVQKRRVRVPKAAVPGFFRHGLITSEMVELQRGAFGDDARRTLEEVSAACRRFGDALRAVAVVNYHRTAWEDSSGTLRVTLDRDVAFYTPPTDLWSRRVALTRETLGAPVAMLEECILEVKATAGLPEWLSRLVGALKPPPERMSKFVLAARALGAT